VILIRAVLMNHGESAIRVNACAEEACEKKFVYGFSRKFVPTEMLWLAIIQNLSFAKTRSARPVARHNSEAPGKVMVAEVFRPGGILVSHCAG
jgi:hypothetical protein